MSLEGNISFVPKNKGDFARHGVKMLQTLNRKLQTEYYKQAVAWLVNNLPSGEQLGKQKEKRVFEYFKNATAQGKTDNDSFMRLFMLADFAEAHFLNLKMVVSKEDIPFIVGRSFFFNVKENTYYDNRKLAEKCSGGTVFEMSQMQSYVLYSRAMQSFSNYNVENTLDDLNEVINVSPSFTQVYELMVSCYTLLGNENKEELARQAVNYATKSPIDMILIKQMGGEKVVFTLKEKGAVVSD